MRWRYLPFYLVLVLSLWLLLWRLFDLTVVQGANFRELSEGNRIQEKIIRAPRGIIYDRLGQVLARNVPVYKKCSSPQNKDCQVINQEEALNLQARDGVEVASLQMDLIREYPWSQLFAHVIGYTGEVSEEEIKTGTLNMGERVGRTGIEEEYEATLRGTDGKELIEVDAKGQATKSLGKVEPKPGQNLTLSLDRDLQKISAGALGSQTGIVLVSNPSTGEILSLYSSPAFDPNDPGHSGNQANKPFFDRVISGLYPPGSTFKIITAASGLETGKINAQTLIEDTGEIVIGPYRYPNWYWLQYGGKEGFINIVTALKRSNDIFFYKVGEAVGVETLAKFAEKFGVGKTLGIDLPNESAGLIPTPSWRKKVLGEDWFLGDTYHLAIGQGNLQVTPLQVNFWTNIIANGGKLCQPRVAKIGQDTPGVARRDSPGVDGCKDIGLKKETIKLIKEGMREACSTGGTAWPLFDFKVTPQRHPEQSEGSPVEARPISVACKTGTAEYGDPQEKTHAWFTVFAPVQDPEISVTVLVEGGGEGSNVGAPIAKKVLEEWFGR